MLLKMDISRAMKYFRKREIQFDIIFLDPPYPLQLVEKSLKAISACGILSTDGQVIAEHGDKEHAPEKAGTLVMTRQNRYGSTLLSFYS